jgi:hypothetical protein
VPGGSMISKSGDELRDADMRDPLDGDRMSRGRLARHSSNDADCWLRFNLGDRRVAWWRCDAFVSLDGPRCCFLGWAEEVGGVMYDAMPRNPGGADGVASGARRLREAEAEAEAAELLAPLRVVVGGVVIPLCARNELLTSGRCVAGLVTFDAESHLSGWGSMRGLDMTVVEKVSRACGGYGRAGGARAML